MIVAVVSGRRRGQLVVMVMVVLNKAALGNAEGAVAAGGRFAAAAARHDGWLGGNESGGERVRGRVAAAGNDDAGWRLGDAAPGGRYGGRGIATAAVLRRVAVVTLVIFVIMMIGSDVVGGVTFCIYTVILKRLHKFQTLSDYITWILLSRSVMPTQAAGLIVLKGRSAFTATGAGPWVVPAAAPVVQTRGMMVGVWWWRRRRSSSVLLHVLSIVTGRIRKVLVMVVLMLLILTGRRRNWRWTLICLTLKLLLLLLLLLMLLLLLLQLLLLPVKVRRGRCMPRVYGGGRGSRGRSRSHQI
jgi:hypothetical protein